jgi:predicted secreted protein
MRWSVKDIGDINTVCVVDSEYIPDKPWPMIGGPGNEVWTFEAKTEGEITITMNYGSVGLTGPPEANTLVIEVFVFP